MKKAIFVFLVISISLVSGLRSKEEATASGCSCTCYWNPATSSCRTTGRDFACLLVKCSGTGYCPPCVIVEEEE